MKNRLGQMALAALLLGGCATTRYTTVYCVGKSQSLPAEPEKVSPKLTGEADKDTRVLAGGLTRWQAYGRGLRTILEGCREPQR